MSGLGVRPLARVKGRAALTKRLRALLLATHRFGRCRATSDDDRRWTARLLDTLDTLALRSTTDTDTRPTP